MCDIWTRGSRHDSVSLSAPVPDVRQTFEDYGVEAESGGGALLDPDATIPVELTHPRFLAVPLTTDLATLDYTAYMASPEVIRVHSHGRWPVAGFSLARHLALVARHQADHESGRALTFVLLTPSKSEALGCVYLNPLRAYLRRVQADERVVDHFPQDTAMVTFWVRQDQLETGLVEAVAEALDEWLVSEWPLRAHLFRILRAERTSRRALERLNLSRVHLALPADEPPYLWYQPT